MNKRFQIKVICMATLSMMVLAMLFALPSPASSQVGPTALVLCQDFAFSVEEDFVTDGPEPPDGDPVISDGDLLGPNHAVCARNFDLLNATFDVPVDLGLDAADVLDADAEDYIVAFSTELDSPHRGQFTAGDLLVTSLGNIIPNVALTDAAGPVGYDLGLDAVQFVGDLGAITVFLTEASGITRDGWLAAPDSLSGMLEQYDIDIWFSTEGTYTAVEGGFLDGDLISARTGDIEAANSDLLPTSVDAGIPVRGVDFGLDAVANDRAQDTRRLHYSTEILHEGALNFTDGDVLYIGNGVVISNYDLISSFEPRATMLGLDALSFGVQEPAGCVNRLTKVNDVDMADISPTDGLIQVGTLTGINAPSPFGGNFEIHGTLCDDVEHYRVKYRLAGTADPWEPIKVLPSKNWQVKVDSFIPAFPDCLGSQSWFSDPDGWFDASDYWQLSEASLGGCNPDLALTVWESATTGADALYEVVLETEDTSGGMAEGDVHLVQLDNTKPTVELQKEAGVCNTLSAGDFPHAVMGRMQDDYFHKYQIHLSGDGYPVLPYTPVAYYDDLTDNVIETGTVSWNSWQALHQVAVDDLNPTGPAVACGYTVMLQGWDRTLFGWFTYPSNLGTRCAGCRWDFDMWTFNYMP